MPSSTPRDRFVAWLHWYMRTHPSTVPTRSALAEKLGLDKSSMTHLFRPQSAQRPSFDTLVAARELTGLPVDVMLFCDPPEVPREEA